jgi:hypothetical protein
MKVRKIDIIVVSVIVGLISFFILVLWINLRIYVDDSKLKITNDISTNDSAVIQNIFGINLPPQAKITALGFSYDLIVIRIEGVKDLPSFLTDSVHLEIDAKESTLLADDIYNDLEIGNSSGEDMYGTDRESWSF